jgi:hypothetical protein
VVTCCRLCERQWQASVPGQNRKSVEDESKEEGWEKQNSQSRVAFRKRTGLWPPIRVAAQLQHGSVPSGDGLELASELERRLTFVVLDCHLAASIDDSGDTAHVALDDGPVESSQTSRVCLVWVGTVAKEELDGDRVALIAGPLQTCAAIAVGGVGQDWELLGEEVGEKEGRRRVGGEVEGIEALGVDKGGICAMADEQMYNVHVAIPGRQTDFSITALFNMERRSPCCPLERRSPQFASDGIDICAIREKFLAREQAIIYSGPMKSSDIASISVRRTGLVRRKQFAECAEVTLLRCEEERRRRREIRWRGRCGLCCCHVCGDGGRCVALGRNHAGRRAHCWRGNTRE